MPASWFDGVTLTVEAALATPPVQQILNANPYFEAGVSDWSAQTGATTCTWSTVRAHQGTGSMLITCPGAVNPPGAITTRYAVTAGVSYTVSAWVYIPDGWSDVRTCVDWYDGAGVFISTGGLGAVPGVPAGTWTYLSQTLTAPPNAASGQMRVRLGSTPPAGLQAWVDEAIFAPPSQVVGVWGAVTWGGAMWGPDVTWTDVSVWVRSIRTDRAFSRDVQAWGAGTATVVLDNRDGRFSPDNLGGPYVVAGVTQVRPWRPLRISATYKGVAYYLYTGYALDWVESWTGGRPGQGDAIVTVPCSDEFGRLGGFDGLEQSAVGAGETSGRRIHRILDNAGHTGARNIAVGRVTMQATTLAQNAVSELKLTTDSEGGGLFVDADGTICFEDQYALIEQSRSNTIQATFGDGGGPDLKYADAQTAYSGDLIRNIASFARTGGTAQTVDDTSSRALYGDRRESRTDLMCETDAQALNLAAFWVERYKQPEKRITGIVVKPRRDPANLYPQVLGRRVRDLVRVERLPPGGYQITRDCHIAGVHHVIDKSRTTWETTFDLWSASVFQQYSGSRWDVGTWDGANTSWFF